MDAALNLIRKAVNHYGGGVNPAHVVRRFSSDGRLSAGQGTLDL